MNKLVAEVSKHIQDRMQGVARSLPGDQALRTVFHGPPLRYLQRVLDVIQGEGGLEVELGNGDSVAIPVLLPVERTIPVRNPPVGQSGMCDDSHILALRNTPACPRFLTLTTPARHSILSVAQATDEFGLSQDNSGASAGISQWWDDSFVRHLVNVAVARVGWKSELERHHARRLLERAVHAADEVDRHDPQRLHAWAALARVLAISDGGIPHATQWSLACGVPPTTEGGLEADEQLRILGRFADAMVDEGFSACVDRLKKNAAESEVHALDECVRHIEGACEVRIALARSAEFYYAPFREDTLSTPPDWWSILTLERLAELLEEDASPQGALTIECTNAVVPSGRGLPAIVLGEVALTVGLPADVAGPVGVSVVREIGPKASRQQWELSPPATSTLLDSAVPQHRQPVRYVVDSPALKKAATRVISLASWEPGVVVSCRSAKKLSLPKKARQGAGLECFLVMAGEGRHYLDLYVSPGVTVSEEAQGEDTSTIGAPLEAMVTRASEGMYGVELVATSECYFELTHYDRAGTASSFRINITCDELPAEGCRSEFERLIRLNRQRERSTAATVQLDRQVRTADLEGWLLDEQQVAHSYYPLAIGPDCRDDWKSPDWASHLGALLSRGKFLHDPRPPVDEFSAPEEWIEARSKLAEKIRGEDGYGMVEAAEFAIWMKDKEFAATVDTYVRSYIKWLEAAPEVAAWVDLAIVCPLEGDGKTLAQEPDAVIVSPIHPLRIGWQCLAQRILLEAWRTGMPCPAASILDPDGVPDALALPLRTPSGASKPVIFLSTECSSDYWSVLWNGGRLGALSARGELQPFDAEFGIQLGGVSSGFSVSQVRRSLDDVATLLSAKPILNVLVSSAAGHTDACNVGLMSWARDGFAETEDESAPALLLGKRLIQVFDERKFGRPEAAAVANLTEDTGGAAKWFTSIGPGLKPDLGIIAQLDTANASVEPSELGSPLGVGALIRHRIRTQLRAGGGAFLSESRMGVERPPSGDGLADGVMRAAVRLENLGEMRHGYTFAPSVQAISSLLREKDAEYVAVSSSSVDPSCFLGGWLDDVYLWDYELPSYSHRSGDTNGYYLLSQVKQLDCETLQTLLQRLPSCGALGDEFLREVLLEVARRGIPTVRGLSASHSGASGDLGLFLAGRLLQDEFRRSGEGQGSTLRVLASDGEVHEIAIVLPVDPFRGYLQDLQKALGLGQLLRPDLVVAGIVITDSSIRCRITPVEVKYRRETMSPQSCSEALGQAAALSTLLTKLKARADTPDLLMWKLAFQHLLLSMLDFGFRVYSQQMLASNTPREWSSMHQRVLTAVLSDELKLEIDPTGRLILFDATGSSAPRDVDGDGFKETIALSAIDSGRIVREVPTELYADIRLALSDWAFFPEGTQRVIPRGDHVSSIRVSTDVGRESRSGPVLDADASGVPADHREEQAQSREPEPSTAPPSVAEVREGLTILVGDDVDGFRAEKRYLSPSDTALNQLNMGVVGDLGTGKTQLLKSLVYQTVSGASQNGGVKPRFLIFDYKKDYSTPDFVKAVGATVVRPQNLPLNLFDISAVAGETVPWMNRFKFFADVLDKIYSNVGPVQRENLKQAVREAYADCNAIGRQPTIHDVHDRYRQRVQGKIDAPLSIIGDIVDMQLFTSDASAGSGFDRFFEGVVVLSLDALGQDDRSKNMLVAFMLNMFYEHMLSIPKRPYVGTDPQLRVIDSYLLVDEADNIMRYEFDVLRKVLLQGREFGVGVILASQYLKHFKAGATDYREPLLTWFIHKVPNISAQELSALGLTGPGTQLADRIRQLPNHQCLFKTFDVPGEIVQAVPFYRLVAGAAEGLRREAGEVAG